MKVRVPVVVKENGTIKIRFIDIIVDVALGMLMATIFVNIAFGIFFSTSTSAFDSNTILLWKALPWVAMAAVFTAFLRYVRSPSTY
jgi:hypothetical protein